MSSWGLERLGGPRRTHEVRNQSKPPADQDLFLDDRAVREAAAQFGASWASESLSAYGRVAGAADTQALAHEANASGPRLQSFDRFGNRDSVVVYHPNYHLFMRRGIEHQVPSFAWNHRGAPGAHVARGILAMLAYQSESGTSCPMSMTCVTTPHRRRARGRREEGDGLRGREEGCGSRREGEGAEGRNAARLSPLLHPAGLRQSRRSRGRRS